MSSIHEEARDGRGDAASTEVRSEGSKKATATCAKVLSVKTKVCARQCAACPWRVDVVPKRDIPGGYSEEKHRRLEATMVDPADPIRSLNGPLMACHETYAGREQVCTGYAANQLKAGHLKLRVLAMRGEVPELHLVGPQHKTLADSLAANKDE